VARCLDDGVAPNGARGLIKACPRGFRVASFAEARIPRAIRQARAGGPIAPIAIDYNIALAERAMPERQATVDALHSLPEIGVEAPAMATRSP
jgi:hypothetical protein